MGFRKGNSGQPALGGAGAQMELREISAIAGGLSPGTNTGFNAGGMHRYGGTSVTIPSLNVFDSGSAGATPNRGRVFQLGASLMRARNTVVGTAPIDFYCGVCPMPITDKLPGDGYGSPAYRAWEVSCLMATETPVGAIDRDCGLIFIMSVNTTYAGYLRQGVNPANTFAGFGVSWDGADCGLNWICKKDGSGAGAALNENVRLVTPGPNRLTAVAVTIVSATRTANAYLTVKIDGIPRLRREWGPGTVLPVPADATFQPVWGYYRPMMRAAQTSANTSALLWRDFCIRAAADPALFD